MFCSAGIFLFKVSSGITKTIREICSELITVTPEWRYWILSGVFFANYEQISHIILLFPLLTINKKMLTEWLFQSLIVFQYLISILWSYYWSIHHSGKCTTSIQYFHNLHRISSAHQLLWFYAKQKNFVQKISPFSLVRKRHI